jgi:hypothetical protein
MATTTILNFTTPTDYSYNTANTIVAGGMATLIDIGTPTDFMETFNDATGLTFNASEVEIVGGAVVALRLNSNSGLAFNEDFADDTDFTYNASNTEFTGGLVRQIQKAYRPTYYLGTFFANYDTDINGNYGFGVLTGTATGGAAVAAGKLDLKGSTQKYVNYTAVGNANSQQSGCIRFKYTPNYSGIPANDMHFFCISEGDANDNNSLNIRHNSVTGNIFLRTCNNLGNYIDANVQVGAWSPVAGTEYEFEFNYNFTVGAQRIFINGNQIGATQVSTGTRSSAINNFRIGCFNIPGAIVSNFEINDFQVFNYPQHTANYTPAAYGLSDPQQPTFYAGYNEDENGDWGNGVLTGTLTNATVSGGYLDLRGGTLKYATYDPLNNFTAAQTGCIRVRWVPNYSGSPASNKNIIDVSDGAGNTNRLAFGHNNVGELFFVLYNAASVSLYSSIVYGTWTPVAGTTYEFELNWDLNAGATRLFVDGVQFGSTKTDIGTYILAGQTVLRIGTQHLATSIADFQINDILLFNNIQHVANYTPDWTGVRAYEYDADVVTLPEMEYTGAGTLVSFDNFATTEGNSPRYALQIARSGNYLYWTGAAWATSNNTFAQANDKATFLANIATLPVNGQIYGQFRIYTQSNNGSQQSVSDLTATLTAQIYPTTNPTIDIDQAILATATGELVAAWNSFIATTSISGSDAVRFVLSDDNAVTWKYWTGAAWAASVGYAQSNNAATVNTNIATFPITANGMMVRVYLHSNDGTTTPNIGNLVVNYDDFIYPITNPIVSPVATVGAEQLLSVAAITIEAGADAVRYTLLIDGIETYWNGSVWTISSGYAQTNTIAEINTNAASLVLTGGHVISPIIYLHSNNGSTTPSIDLFALTYNFFSGIPDIIDRCVVWGYIYDSNGDPIEGVTVSAQIPNSVGYKTALNIGIVSVSATTSATGYWELELIDTFGMIPNTTKYKFAFSGVGISRYALKSIPAQATIKYNELA